MFSSLRVKGISVPDGTCSISDCLFPRISSHFFYVNILFRCKSSIVFVDITGVLKIV